MTLDEALHRNAELGVQVQRFEEELKISRLTIEKLKVEVAYLGVDLFSLQFVTVWNRALA